MPGSAPFARLLRLCLLAAALLGFAAPSRAEVYRIDVIVFADRGPVTEAPNGGTLPNFAGSLLPDNPAALQAAGVTLLPDDQFALQGEWQRLRNSRRFQPLARLAWTQRDPPGARGPSLRLRVGAAEQPMLDGSLALLIVNRYLTLDADLLYVSGSDQWRFEQRRKMRRDELHHVDGGRLGIVTRVTKADGGNGGAP